MHRRPGRGECMRRKLSELELEANEGAPALHVCVITSYSVLYRDRWPHDTS